MRIEKIEVVKVRVPLGRPYVISRGPTYAFTNLLVRIRGENGQVGLGECTDLSVVGGIDRSHATIRDVMAPAIVGMDLPRR